MRAFIAGPDATAVLRTEWQMLLDITEQARSLNDANGLIIEAGMRANQQAREVLNAREAVERTFEEPGARTPVTFRIIEDESPAGVVLHQAQTADLVIIGVAQEWGLESHLFGWRAQRIARDCPSSLLIVRRGSHGWKESSSVATNTPAQRPTLTHLATDLRPSDATKGTS